MTGWLARAAHILTWRHCAWATGLGVLLGVLVPLQNLHLNFYFTFWRMLYDTPFYVAYAWTFLLAIVLVEASVAPDGWPSLWRYFAGAVAASLVCVGLAWSLSDHYQLPPKRVISGGSRLVMGTYAHPQRLTMSLFEVGFDGVVNGWLATFIYAGLRRSRRAARVLADAEIGRSEAQRTFVAARLLAAHAQVDPEFVMRSLEAIEAAYETDPAAADLRLDELITFLRDAIPRVRSGMNPAMA